MENPLDAHRRRFRLALAALNAKIAIETSSSALYSSGRSWSLPMV